ncbi:MAG: CPBP family intramembrane metalloprotease [bacterium]|nr:CPBP family intramembrane metalloprotease [bacterium]
MVALLHTRRAPTWLLATVLLVLYPWSWFVNQWFMANEHYRYLLRASDGLLFPNLQVCAPTILLWLLVFRLAGLRFADIGWCRRDLGMGALMTLVVWVAIHIVAVIVNWSELTLFGELLEAPQLTIGRLFGQLLGNALYEETIYRGFCMTQFLLLLLARGHGQFKAVSLAALGSAAMFALPHIPNRLARERYDDWPAVLGDQTMLLCSGLFLAWIYIRTRNLWWAVGLHSLANCPTLLVVWQGEGSRGNSVKALVSLFGLLITVAWPWLRRRGRDEE